MGVIPWVVVQARLLLRAWEALTAERARRLVPMPHESCGDYWLSESEQP